MRPHNLTLVMIGAGILWFGWFGFNAGSALGAGTQAAGVWVNTLAATCTAMLGWLIVEKIRDGHPTSLGAASGVVAGLVAITPACATVSPIGALIVGLVAGAGCALAVGLKFRFGFDDSLDVVGVHLVGGLIGTLLIGLLATKGSPTGAAGLDVNEGLFYGGGFSQLGAQVVGAFVVLVFSFVMTYLIGLAIHKTMGFRVDEAEESQGVDLSEHAESAYDLSGLSGGRSAPLGAISTTAQRQDPRGSTGMKLVTAIIKPHQLDEVKEALEAYGISGHDRQRGVRLRPPARPQRGLPRSRVHRRLRAEGPRRGPRRRHRRRARWPTSSSRPPRPAGSATARSGPSPSTTSSGSAPANAASTPSDRTTLEKGRHPGRPVPGVGLSVRPQR